MKKDIYDILHHHLCGEGFMKKLHYYDFFDLSDYEELINNLQEILERNETIKIDLRKNEYDENVFYCITNSLLLMYIKFREIKFYKYELESDKGNINEEKYFDYITDLNGLLLRFVNKLVC